MQLATLCFLTDGTPPTKVLLGRKKVGLGVGKFNGYGGKVEKGERIETAVIRELFEESTIHIAESQLQKVGVITFTEPNMQDWQAHVYLVPSWSGTPHETREMTHHWFALEDIPYNQMWADDWHWLPQVLAGKHVTAIIDFNADGETVANMDIQFSDD
ncbi:MAG: 8-oxo-dGTP diphosphatase [Chloroflexi bacterium]|nr:8-oxo-dGTP diphosphatase [Chloroflexota bacterium]